MNITLTILKDNFSQTIATQEIELTFAELIIMNQKPYTAQDIQTGSKAIKAEIKKIDENTDHQSTLLPHHYFVIITLGRELWSDKQLAMHTLEEAIASWLVEIEDMWNDLCHVRSIGEFLQDWTSKSLQNDDDLLAQITTLKASYEKALQAQNVSTTVITQLMEKNKSLEVLSKQKDERIATLQQANIVTEKREKTLAKNLSTVEKKITEIGKKNENMAKEIATHKKKSQEEQEKSEKILDSVKTENKVLHKKMTILKQQSEMEKSEREAENRASKIRESTYQKENHAAKVRETEQEKIRYILEEKNTKANAEIEELKKQLTALQRSQDDTANLKAQLEEERKARMAADQKLKDAEEKIKEAQKNADWHEADNRALYIQQSVIKNELEAKNKELDAFKQNQSMAIQHEISYAYNHKLQEEKERLHKGIMQVLFPSIAHPHNNTTHVTYHGYAPVNLYSIPQPTVQIPIIPHKNQ